MHQSYWLLKNALNILHTIAPQTLTDIREYFLMLLPVNFLSHCIPCWLHNFIIKIDNAAYQTILSRSGAFLIFWMTIIVLHTVRSHSVTRHHCLLFGCHLATFSWGFFLSRCYQTSVLPSLHIQTVITMTCVSWFHLMRLIIASTIYQLMNLVVICLSNPSSTSENWK